MKKMMYLVAFSMLVGCSSSGKFGNLTSDNFSVTPKVLELKGGEVPVTVTGSFPRDFFPKEGEVEFTPVLVGKGKSVKGEKIVFYGEKIKNPGLIIVSHEYGGTFSESQSFSFTEDMKMSELYADIKVRQGGKEINAYRIKLAEGIITTPMLVDIREASILSRETYGMGSSDEKSGTIQYVVQRSDIEKSELSKPEIQNLLGSLKNSDKKSYIRIVSAASPEGTEGFNSELARKRDKEATKYVSDELKRMKMDIPIEHAVIDEDWDGLYANIAASNLKDKNQIIQSLRAEQSIMKRQELLHGYMRSNGLFEASLLPPLRKSKITLYTEEERLTTITAKNMLEKEPNRMSLNDRLCAACEMNDGDKKIEAYRAIIGTYPEDWRAYNNLGVVYLTGGEWDDASSAIDQSIKKQERTENTYNKGFVHLAKGNIHGAKTCFTNASSSMERNNSKGAAEILNGNYPEAVAIYGNSTCNNAALAQILNKDYSKASSTLSKIETPNATTYYLKAIVGARTHKKDMVFDNLKEVMSMDKRLGHMAKTDAEFANYMQDSRFTSMLQ